MVESRFIEQFNKLIDDAINLQKEFLPTLQNSTKQLIDEIDNYINNNNRSPSEPDIKEKLSNYFTCQLRLRHQKEIINNISNEKKNNFN